MHLFVLLLVTSLSAAAGKVRYDGYQVVSIVPETEEQAHWLQQQQLKYPGDVIFWNDLCNLGASLDVQLSPTIAPHFIPAAERSGMKIHLLFKDLQKEIDRQEHQHAKTVEELGESKEFPLNIYHTLAEINERLDYFVEKYPNDINKTKIGETVEGRDIYSMYIGSGSKKIVAFDFGIHAREWISPAVGLYMITQLLESTDPDVLELRNRYNWLIIPVLNPDGYEYTWSTNRNWRKNRNVLPSGCGGIDLNRNFDANFGGNGSSPNPCDETYHGPYAFSELESQAERDLFLPLNGSIISFYSVHSYCQLWMTPYSFKAELPDEYEEQMRVAKIGVDALRETSGTEYLYGNTNAIIYASSGGNRDYFFMNLHIVYTYGLELRDTGEFGFLLPEEQIIPTSVETWNGFKAAILAMPYQRYENIK